MGKLKLEEFGDRMARLVPQLNAEFDRYENSILTCHNINATQLLVLECLLTCGHCRINTLGNLLKGKFLGITAIINGLIKMGFVIRENGKEDRRTVFIALSTKGRKILLQVYQQRRKAFMQLFSKVSAKERESYLTILENLKY